MKKLLFVFIILLCAGCVSKEMSFTEKMYLRERDFYKRQNEIMQKNIIDLQVTLGVLALENEMLRKELEFMKKQKI